MEKDFQMKYKPYDQELANQVKDLYLDKGLTMEETANRLGITRDRARYYFYNKLGYRNPKGHRKKVYCLNHIPESKVNRVLQLARFGYSDLEISQDQNLKTDEVRTIIRSKNISKSA